MAARLDAGDGCAARDEAAALQAETIAAVNDGRVPDGYHEELVGSVNALVESIECAPAAPAPEPEEDADDEEESEDDEDGDEDDGEGKGKGKGKQKGKKG